MRPLLTIGIPHLNRTELLERAIKSCLAQTAPVHIVVADQGKTQATAEMLERYPMVERFDSPATCLQENWEQAARACDTPYFSWLQDDDILRKSYAARIIAAFEKFPDALHWQATLKCSTDTRLMLWFLGNGPWLPMDPDGGQAQWNGDILIPTAYFTSWALAPAWSFRCGEAFNAALSAMPRNCDIFIERLIIAETGLRGPFVVDPMIAGTWVQHEKNESRNQWPDQPRQTRMLVEHLDPMMDQLKDWQATFKAWVDFIPTHNVIGWITQLNATASEGKEGKYIPEIGKLMLESLKGRIEIAQASEPSKKRPFHFRLPKLPRIEFGQEPLYDIAVRHQTDKEWHHHYTQYYDEAFTPLRNKPVTLLEIGIGGYDFQPGGESLRMWRDYFKRGHIYGIDIEAKPKVDGSRIKTFQGSQDDKEFLSKVISEIGSPDIIIDDGSHESPHQIASFGLLFPYVKPGGWYVIEDTRLSYRDLYGGCDRKDEQDKTCMGHFVELAHRINGADWTQWDYFAANIDSIRFVLNMIFVRKTGQPKIGCEAGKTEWVKV